MKTRPTSANPTKRKSVTISNAVHAFAAKRDLNVMLSPDAAGKFLDNSLFKLTETTAPDHKTILSTQISQELHMLKGFTNVTQLSKTTTNWKINKLNVEMEQVKSAEAYGKKIPQLLQRIDELNENILQTKQKQEEKLADREVYYHIEKRLITTKIHMDMKTHYLQEKLNIKGMILKTELEKSLKVRESRCRSARMYRNYDKTAGFFNKHKQILRVKFSKETELISNIELMRKEKEKRHLEICEEVDNEETIRRFKGLRERIMLYRMLYMLLSNKLKENIAKFGTIELAFRKIRSITGLHDINDVVEKFLTKENSYHELMNMILQNKSVKEALQKRNNELENKILNYTISEKPSVKSEIVKDLISQIAHFTNRNNYEKERNSMISTVKFQINTWVKKTIRKFKPEARFREETLGDLMKILKNIVQGMLKNLQTQPNMKIIKELTANQVNEPKKGQKLSYIEKMQFISKEKDHSLSFSELNYVEVVTDSKKKTLFAPLLEKALRKK